MSAAISPISPDLPIPPSSVEEPPASTPTNAMRRGSIIANSIENPLPQNAPG